MLYLLITTDHCLPYSIATSRQQRPKLPTPWHRLLKWLSTPGRVSGLYGKTHNLQSAENRPGYLHHFQLFRHGPKLNMCWPHSSNASANAARMRDAHQTGRRLQQSPPEYPSVPGNDDGNRREHGSQRWRDPPAATDCKLQQDYEELLLEFNRLKAKHTARGQEVAFYRNVVSESTWKEMCCRMQELQDQLGQFSADYSRASHEHNQRSQNRASMRDSMDRLSEAVLILTRQNEALQEGCRLKEGDVPRSERDGFLSTAEPEEDLLRRASRIPRKKARTDLRSQTGDKSATPLKSLDGRLMKSQAQPEDEVVAEIPALKNDFLALQSKLKSAQDHIIHLGGNMGALIPCDVVKNVSTKRRRIALVIDLILTPWW